MYKFIRISLATVVSGIMLAALVNAGAVTLHEPSPVEVVPASGNVLDAPTAMCGRCGDGVCVATCGENTSTCPADCSGSSSATEAKMCGRCGDGVCVATCGENTLTCPADCSGSSSATCS